MLPTFSFVHESEVIHVTDSAALVVNFLLQPREIEDWSRTSDYDIEQNLRKTYMYPEEIV